MNYINEKQYTVMTKMTYIGHHLYLTRNRQYSFVWPQIGFSSSEFYHSVISIFLSGLGLNIPVCTVLNHFFWNFPFQNSEKIQKLGFIFFLNLSLYHSQLLVVRNFWGRR